MGAPLCFYVHRNGANQPVYTGQYNRMLFTHADMNDCGHFDCTQSRWIAPCDGRVHFQACVFVNAGLSASNNANATIKFIKNSSTGAPPQVPNGTDCFAVVGGPLYPFTVEGIGIANGGGWWEVAECDAIELALYDVSNSGGHSVVVDGHRAHTYWSGAFFAA